MHLWLIQTGEPLPLDSSVKKMRTSLLADKLIEKGHSVLWWTSAFDHLKKKWIYDKDTCMELKKGLSIFALKGKGYKKNISLARFIDHRMVALKFKKKSIDLAKPDLIITATPPHDIAYQAVMYAKKNKVPVVVDVRDEWPELFINFFPKMLHPLMKIFLSYDFHLLKKTLKHADSLISMMDSLLQWALKYAQRSQSEKDKVFYLGGRKITPEGPSSKLEFLDKLNKKFVVTFLGTFVENNDPTILVECAKRIKNAEIHFILAGDGELLNTVKEKAGGVSTISFPGWLNQDEINEVLKKSDVGIAPSKEIRNAFPNKVFSYFSAGIPVITSFGGDLKNLLEIYQMGFYYPSNNVESLKNFIHKLYTDQNLYNRMSENVKKVFKEKFDTDIIYEAFSKHIETIAQTYKKS